MWKSVKMRVMQKCFLVIPIQCNLLFSVQVLSYRFSSQLQLKIKILGKHTLLPHNASVFASVCLQVCICSVCLQVCYKTALCGMFLHILQTCFMWSPIYVEYVPDYKKMRYVVFITYMEFESKGHNTCELARVKSRL